MAQTTHAPAPHRLLRGLKLAVDAVGIVLFLVAFFGFIVQVFFRYALNQPLAWTEEFTMIFFIWAVFWAAAFMVRIKGHVSFDVVYDVLPPGARRWCAIISMAFLLVAFLALIPATWDYMMFLTRKKSPVLRVPMWSVYGSYFIFIVAFTAQAGWRLWALCSRRWEEQI